MADADNPLTHPEKMRGIPPTMDADKTTHPGDETVAQDYHFNDNTRSQTNTATLNKPTGP